MQSDPLIPMDRTLIPSPPPRPKNPVFDDEEKSKVQRTPVCRVLRRGLARCRGELHFLWGLPRWAAAFPFTFDTLLFQLLAKLLKSKNPDDLQEANKLIKSMVKEVSGPWALGHGMQELEKAEVPSLGVRPAVCPPPPALTWRGWRME